MVQRELSFGEAVRKALLENYCNFNGRAARSEYWWYVLFTCIVSAVISSSMFISDIFGETLSSLVSLALLLPGLGVSWRRMHDIGKGGGWIFINLVPLVGTIIYIVLCCRPSENGANRFGNEPNVVY